MSMHGGFFKNGATGSQFITCDERLGTKQATRVCLVVSIPIIFLIGITANALSLSIKAYNAAVLADDSVGQAIDLSKLVNNIQVERGYTSMFLGFNRTNLRSFAALFDARSETDIQLYKLGRLPPLSVNNHSLITKADMETYIKRHRSKVDTGYPLLSLEENMSFYTDINQAILAKIADSIKVPSLDRWLVAFNSLFKAKDIIGIKRAVGSTYYSKCSFSEDHEAWFSSLDIQFDTYLDFTFRYHQESKDRNERTMDPNIKRTILLFNKQLMDAAYGTVCLNKSIDARNLMSEFWFGNMTININHLGVIMKDLANDLTQNINNMRLTAQTEVIIYSFVLFFVLLCSCVTVYLLYVMTSNMQDIARGLNSKTTELQSEQQRMEELLSQMLPKMVAYRLKMNLEVPAEYYDMVTICFSDVVGFTRISAKLSPHQVVDFLNGLYSLFDMIIEKYDAYKVETIGDAYMVASGIPERNGHEHARQIALMALNVQKSSSGFIIPHTDEYIKVRSGIHSGPCASGVVGTKMPRYCLFGDTVNTASRMESMGDACRIHISSKTKTLLDMDGGFTCEERGAIDVKGKGSMCTYWLIGSDGERPKTDTDTNEAVSWPEVTLPGTVYDNGTKEHCYKVTND